MSVTNSLLLEVLQYLNTLARDATCRELAAPLADKLAAAMQSAAERQSAGGSHSGPRNGRPGLPLWVDTGDWTGWVYGAPSAAKLLHGAGFRVTTGTLAVALSRNGRWTGQAQTDYHEPERHGFVRKPNAREQAKLDAEAGTKDAG